VQSPAQFLDYVELRAKQLIWAGVVATLAGLLFLILVPANHPSSPRVIFLSVTLLCGPATALIMPHWLVCVRQARRVLNDPPSDLFLSAQFRRTLHGGAKDGAGLFSDPNGVHPVAGFGVMGAWSRPLRLTVARTPAKVYGNPVRGAAVVVTVADRALVGRIGATEFRDSQSMSPLGRWLFKERRLRLPGREP
jgi:hypothetical protein